MRNKQLLQSKLERIDGKLKAVRVMSTRRGVTVQDIHKILDEIEELVEDVSTMVERED